MRVAAILAQYPPGERQRRETAMRAAAPADAELEFHYIDATVFRKGLTHLHRAQVAPLIARAAKAAQQGGCSAAVPYGTLDLGVEEARHVVDIPVVGPGRTAATVATTLAERFAVIVYDQPHVSMQVSLLRTWGVSGAITSIRPVDVEVVEMAADPGRLRKALIEQASAAIRDEGAQLVVPLGMTMVPVLLSAHDLGEEIGVPVLDPLALALQLAGALARTGYTNSRAAYPAACLD